MTPDQVKLIQLSFIQVMQQKAEVGETFYRRLFEIAPQTRAMFKADIKVQAQKLMDMLALAIGSLRNPSALNGLLHSLGTSHAKYGVREEHYAKVGEALLWTLEHKLGDDCTPPVRAAWAELYGAVAAAMQNASREAANVA